MTLKRILFFLFIVCLYFCKNENKSAINWPQECGVFMNTKSINEWNEILVNVGFKNIQYWQVGEKDNWAGTLVFFAEK